MSRAWRRTVLGSRCTGRVLLRTNRLLAVGVALLACGLLVPLGAAQDEAATSGLDITLASDFELANATLFVGRMDFDVDGYRNPVFVQASRLVARPVNVTACPVEDQGDSIVRGLLLASRDCEGGETHFMPQVSFGARTWLQLAGLYGVRPATSGSMSLFVPEGPFGGATVASVLGNGSMPFGYRDDQMRFQPLVSSSQVIVTTRDDRVTYNGTDWMFLFGGGGEATVVAEGFHASFGDRVPFRLGRMAPEEIGPATRASVLLDLQETVLGPDEREPVANVTRLLDLSRSPVFLNGAVVGRINGTAADRDMAGDTLAQVRFGSLAGFLAGSRLTGAGTPDLVLVPSGVVVGDEVGAPPWVLGVILWVAAGLAFFLGRSWHPPYRWSSWVELALLLLLFLFVDRVVAWRLGEGSLGLLFGNEYGFAVALRLLVFVLVTTAGLVGLLYLPVRVIGRHVLPACWAALATPVAFVVAVVYGLVASAGLIATGFVFARL